MASPSLQSCPALRAAVLCATGILFGHARPDGLPFFLIVSGSLSVMLLILPRIVMFRGLPATPIVVLLCVATGAAKITWDTRTAGSLSAQVTPEEVVLIGDVADAPQKTQKRIRFVLEGFAIVRRDDTAPFPLKILVTAAPSKDRIPEYGMTLALRGMLSRPSPARNPGEFDQRRYYDANGITRVMDVPQPEDVIILRASGGWWLMREVVMPVRNYILKEIDRSIGGQEGEYLKGVLIGERGGLLPEIREAFTAAGVAHILAVSGSNVAVVAAFVFFALELVRLPRRVRMLVACCAVWFYMLIVGYQPPVVRATIMAIVFLVGRILGQRANPLNSLGISGLIVLGLDSRQLFDVGFQLSFAAVFSIVYFYPIIDKRLRFISGKRIAGRSVLWVLRLCSVSLAATLGTLPLTAGYFGGVSLIGLVANTAVVPASGLSLLLGFISIPLSLVNPWLADTYAGLNMIVLRLTLELTVAAGSLPFASIGTPGFSITDAIVFYTGLTLVFHLDRKSFRGSLTVLFLLALNIRLFLPAADGTAARTEMLRVSFLDVGQGDAALVELPEGHSLLIDAGPLTASVDAGKRTVLPFLLRHGISRLDLLIITHPHSDHLGGAASVLRGVGVGEILDCGVSVESGIYSAYRDESETGGVLCRKARTGDLVSRFPRCRLYILAPEESSVSSSDLNNASVVVKLVFGDVTILFTGDAESEAEEKLVARYGGFLHATLLKTGHHGSRTSSTRDFIEAVDPTYAVISVGDRNRYGHPSPQTLQRFEDSGIRVFRTDRDGAVIFESDGRTIRQIHWRDD